MSKKWENDTTEALFGAIASLKTAGEAKRFLRDLLTENELLEFGNRWQAARMLNEKVSYTTIQDKTGLSTTTIARISKWLKTGMGGYGLVLARLHHTHLSEK
jgi:TrpR-related protein YerC/YecD